MSPTDTLNQTQTEISWKWKGFVYMIKLFIQPSGNFISRQDWESSRYSVSYSSQSKSPWIAFIVQPLQQSHRILGSKPNIHLCEEKTALKENRVKRDLTTEKNKNKTSFKQHILRKVMPKNWKLVYLLKLSLGFSLWLYLFHYNQYHHFLW